MRSWVCQSYFYFDLDKYNFASSFLSLFFSLFTGGKAYSYIHGHGHTFFIYKGLNLVFEYAQKSSLQQSDVRLCVPLQYMEILVAMRTRLLLC